MPTENATRLIKARIFNRGPKGDRADNRVMMMYTLKNFAA